MAYMRLGDLLVSSGIITGEQLEQALALPREDGQRLGDVLIRQGVISEAQLIDALRVQLGVDFVDLTAVSIPVELAKYKGQTAGGAKVSGVLRAYDEFEAADKLCESVAIITKLEAVPEKKESVLSRPVAFRVKEKELALLCSQFAIILASGLSVERCVSMVAAQTKNKYLRRMLDKVSVEVGAGYSLAQSFENNAPYLPKTFTETLRAGEQSGTLESCFQRLHAYYDRSAKTRAKIVSTLTYPVMVIIVAIVVFVIIIAVAVPAFTDAFTDLGSGSLPGVTRALMAVSAFFTKWWWLVLGVLALLVIACLTFRRTERGRARWPPGA